jgi:hypothetical protein
VTDKEVNVMDRRTNSDARPILYLSGKITDYQKAAEFRFDMAEQECKQAGYKVYNPWKEGKWLKVELDTDVPSEQQFMHFYVDNILFKMDCIYMLASWSNSAGARIERAVAKRRNIPIYYEVDGPPPPAHIDA